MLAVEKSHQLSVYHERRDEQGENAVGIGESIIRHLGEILCLDLAGTHRSHKLLVGYLRQGDSAGLLHRPPSLLLLRRQTSHRIGNDALRLRFDDGESGTRAAEDITGQANEFVGDVF